MGEFAVQKRVAGARKKRINPQNLILKVLSILISIIDVGVSIMVVINEVFTRLFLNMSTEKHKLLCTGVGNTISIFNIILNQYQYWPWRSLYGCDNIVTYCILRRFVQINWICINLKCLHVCRTVGKGNSNVLVLPLYSGCPCF